MTPLGTLFRPGSCKPPKIDQHSLFTSIQVSIAVLEGNLQIYEPWKKKRSKPKDCHATLYVNETSPFLVWCKLDKGQRSSTNESPVSPTYRPRCVISVSRAKLAKTAGGSFEMTDFASRLTFRFVAKTVREAEAWVEKLAEESLREANLDMRSICSSRSSFSSTSGLPSPDRIESSSRYFSFVSPEKRAGKSEKSSKIFELCNLEVIEDENERNPQVCETCNDVTEKDDVFIGNEDCACQLSSPNNFNTPLACLSPRHHQTHVRAQPHLGLNMVLDKHRPELRSVITDMPGTSQAPQTMQTPMPLSEYFVHLPNI